MTGRPDPSDDLDGVLFAMGFFAMLLPVVTIVYATVAVVIGWARPLEAGVGFAVVLIQIALVYWSDERRSRKRVGDIAWLPVIVLARVVGRLSSSPGMRGVGEGMAASSPLWYPALVLTLAILLVP